MSRRDEPPEDDDLPEEPGPTEAKRDPNPHDRLFRDTMSVETHAAGELRAAMPAKLAAQIDWSTLRQESGTLADAVGESRVLGTVEQANISGGVREVVMTLAEQWKAEGIAQGKAEGKAESLLMFLRGRFSELPEEAEQRVRTASVAELDRWLLRVVTAESVDDVWG